MSKRDEDDPWKRDVEKVVKRSATTGKYVAGSGGTGSRDSKSTESEEGKGKMAKGNDGNRHVVPNKERGGWDVVKENRKRASAHFDTQKEAEERAREIVDKTSRGNGEVITHGRDGKIRDSDSGRRNETKAKDTK